jgi:hypothetical protein
MSPQLQPALPPSLILRRIRRPSGDGQLRVFADWSKAACHLRDHLLGEPESRAWLLIHPSLAGALDWDSSNARWRWVCQALATQGADGQDLYDQFCAIMDRELQDAGRANWLALDPTTGVLVTFSTNGVLAIVTADLLRTAFVAGQGSLEATVRAQQQGFGKQMPRHNAMRQGRLASGQRNLPERERRRAQERQASWSEPQNIYYTVFRPAMQFVRRTTNSAYDALGRPLRQSDYSRLKDVLPPVGKLDFNAWTKLRTTG